MKKALVRRELPLIPVLTDLVLSYLDHREIFRPDLSWGRQGKSHGEFHRPVGLTICNDEIYVLDEQYSRNLHPVSEGSNIKVFSLKEPYKILRSWGRFNFPTAIVSYKNEIIVGDTNGIYTFNLFGEIIRNWKISGDCTNIVIGICIHNDEIYITNARGKQGEVYTFNGEFLRPVSKDPLYECYSICISEEAIYAHGHSTLRVLDFEGNCRQEWKTEVKENEFNIVIVTNNLYYSKGEIYIMDSDTNRVFVYSTQGKLRRIWRPKRSSHRRAAVNGIFAYKDLLYTVDMHGHVRVYDYDII